MRNMFLYDVLMGGAWGGDGLVLFYLHEASQHVAVFAPDGERRMSGPYRDVFPDLYVGREGEVLIVPSAARFLELVRRHPDVVPGAPVSEDGNHVVLRCRLRYSAVWDFLMDICVAFFVRTGMETDFFV